MREYNPIFYIFTWRGKFELAEILRQEIINNGYPCIIISSSTPKTNPSKNVLHIGDMAFYMEQWKALLKVHDHLKYSHAIMIQADVLDVPIKLLWYRVKEAYEFHSCGIYNASAGNKRQDSFLEVIAEEQSKFYRLPDEKFLDVTIWALRSDILALGPLDYPEYLKIGWGIEWYYAKICKDLGYQLILDDGFKVTHIPGTGYNIAYARTGCKKYVSETVMKANHYIEWRQHGIDCIWCFGDKDLFDNLRKLDLKVHYKSSAMGVLRESNCLNLNRIIIFNGDFKLQDVENLETKIANTIMDFDVFEIKENCYCLSRKAISCILDNQLRLKSNNFEEYGLIVKAKNY